MTTITVEQLLEKILAGNELSEAAAVQLLKVTNPDVRLMIQETANQLRRQQVGDVVTYVINRNINFTNICEQHCSFCAFRRDAGAAGAFWLDWEQIEQKAAEGVRRGATEICMQGGLNPAAKVGGACLPYYIKLVQTIKNRFPDLHLHAFSPQEVQFIAREDGLTYEQVIGALADAGAGSMPGTAAEVLDDRIRQVICPEKLNSQTWLEIVCTAHRLGMPTTSTMLCGHIETPEQQVNHLAQLRSLQKTAIERNYPARITEFILLPFVGGDGVGREAPAPLRRRVGRDQPVLADTLHLTAVARMFLGDWIPNHQPSWVKLGLAGATEALNWGCNDIGGTLMEEHITTMAGAVGGTCLEPETLQAAIASIGRQPQQRDTLYKPVDRRMISMSTS
ncbi:MULTISPECIES: 7,8-didemethyl-8-hydroxy-5-deazariboflavin synthase subunit CofH [Planktothricoides]|uniref:5-amino-6-(D-ribitylamino)uracil--L-tyrosine 4-hydroxyphenyl transferase n=2 Tax=Planktothricoides raciborskii TaxID=132608 RepID=A0AAU8JGV3_9CYAN|nr:MULTISPECIES: 7,8-didemethyl-8-hydroxy-5-deazariboflavin synthase subunit CofH [Planktothricoides]KOR35215.1 FO synthase [Planktothricoides sp. SR001]MBD2544818.1 7,8-didemethyl-8-hydroxy-5-deazariboflavin synthase subunit CofH [Planktothricoides raciborskii FACHB-1370]MBD2582775.1 7,8-didemethyl-8-hydroxy-5-deazariboflavin synthase subunit CofH [Planktothricoides raciborskii FACHB-1261]